MFTKCMNFFSTTQLSQTKTTRNVRPLSATITKTFFYKKYQDSLLITLRHAESVKRVMKIIKSESGASFQTSLLKKVLKPVQEG